MPAGPGESLLTTVYADVHYFFRAASPSQPQHHRFSKGSYVYLYYSAVDRRAKLEIANHAGTPDQDAFHGFFDAVQQITYSTKHPTLCSIALNQPSIKTQAEWHLPTWDDRNEKRWAHKLHSIDLYFWTEKDGANFTAQLRAIVPPTMLNFEGVTGTRQTAPSEHRDSMSPVVQQLEQTAIGAQFPPRAASTTSAQSLPGPPTPASGASLPPPPQPAQQPTPMAYNPAAPAAPEPITHREKTPPPPDGAAGTGLTGAARHDSMAQQYGGNMTQQYARLPPPSMSSLQSTPQSSYFPGAPQTAPPTQTQFPRQASFGPQATAPGQYASFPAGASTQYASYPANGSTQYASYPANGSTQYASYPANGFAPSVTSPGLYQQQPPTPSAPPAYGTHTPLQSPGLPPPPPLQQPAQSSHPQVAGFSAYQYKTAPQAAPIPGQYSQAGAYTGDTHAQLYRPTEEEAAHGHHKPRPQAAQQTSSFEEKYRISERVNKMEKGIGGFLKKLDQKF